MTMSASLLDQIRSANGKKQGCFVCGGASAATVEVRVREATKDSRGNVVSRSKTACEQHAVELFHDLEKVFNKRRRVTA